MNKYQEINELLDHLLGPVGRAIWLAARVDDKELYVIAKEHELPLGQVRDILATCDWAIDRMDWAPKQQPLPLYHPCYEGFHQMGDA